MSILTANQIVVRYNERVVLNGLTLAIGERDRIGMVGRNGSGKSTFLRILAGLQQPDSGEITRRRDLMIGYLPQEPSVFRKMTTAQNILAVLETTGLRRREQLKRLEELLEEFGIGQEFGQQQEHP